MEWRWTIDEAFPDYDRVETPPIVADIDQDGTPDVLFTAFKSSDYKGFGAVFAVSADGTLPWSADEYADRRVYGISGIAVGIVDDSRQPAIFLGVDGGLVRLTATGELVWYSKLPSKSGGHVAPALADLDGDGRAEVIVEARSSPPMVSSCSPHSETTMAPTTAAPSAWMSTTTAFKRS